MTDTENTEQSPLTFIVGPDGIAETKPVDTLDDKLRELNLSPTQKSTFADEYLEIRNGITIEEKIDLYPDLFKYQLKKLSQEKDSLLFKPSKNDKTLLTWLLIHDYDNFLSALSKYKSIFSELNNKIEKEKIITLNGYTGSVFSEITQIEEEIPLLEKIDFESFKGNFEEQLDKLKNLKKYEEYSKLYRRCEWLNHEEFVDYLKTQIREFCDIIKILKPNLEKLSGYSAF